MTCRLVFIIIIIRFADALASRACFSGHVWWDGDNKKEVQTSTKPILIKWWILQLTLSGFMLVRREDGDPFEWMRLVVEIGSVNKKKNKERMKLRVM